MKNYILLYRYGRHYYPINDSISSNLRYLVDFFAGDYRDYDKSLFINAVNCYNASFVFNDLKNNILYIGCSEWEIFEEINMPTDEEFPHYVNDTNSCKISHDNFIEFRKKWVQLKQDLLSFALLYRDDNDWVDVQGFQSQEEMEAFVRNAKNEVIH